jgi:SAM-dependent methyltransferase
MLPEAFDTLWALSALRVAVDQGMFDLLVKGPAPLPLLAREARLDPTIALRVVDVLVSHGLFQSEHEQVSLTEKGRAQAARGPALRADLAVTVGQTRALVEEAHAGTLRAGWRPSDPEVIRSQATLSFHMSMAMMRPMREAWPDLVRTLEGDDAVFVDIGVGGAGGSCAMCKLFPKLRVVGIDPLPAALALARENVAAHGLTDRIELRAQRGGDLTGNAEFDVAFLPAKFFDDAAVEETLRALSTSLKPEGFILTAAWRDPGEPRAAAVSKLRDELWGAGPRPTDTVSTMLVRAGFREVRLGPAVGSMVPMAARR